MGSYVLVHPLLRLRLDRQTVHGENLVYRRLPSTPYAVRELVFSRVIARGEYLVQTGATITVQEVAEGWLVNGQKHKEMLAAFQAADDILRALEAVIRLGGK